MADNLTRLLVQMQGWAALLEANHEDAMRWIAEFLNGHPKAQDFEPTGHGGSDPTSVNGIRPDTAAQDGKDYEKHIRAAWRSLDAAVHISKRYQTALRPKRQPDDLSDVWCVLHLQLGYPEPRAHLDLCDPCYRFKCTRGDYPTLTDVQYYITHYGRWPTLRVDPKQHTPTPKAGPIAGLDRLGLNSESLTAEQAAAILQKEI